MQGEGYFASEKRDGQMIRRTFDGDHRLVETETIPLSDLRAPSAEDPGLHQGTGEEDI